MGSANAAQPAINPPCSTFVSGNSTNVPYVNSIVAAKNSLSGIDSNGYFCPAGAGEVYNNIDKKAYVGLRLVSVFNASSDTAFYQYATPEYFPHPVESYTKKTENTPCDCHGQQIKWAAEHLPLKNTNAQSFVDYIKGRYPDTRSWDPTTQGSPCDYVQLGMFLCTLLSFKSLKEYTGFIFTSILLYFYIFIRLYVTIIV